MKKNILIIIIILLSLFVINKIANNKEICQLFEENTIYKLWSHEPYYELKPNSKDYINSKGFRDYEDLKDNYNIIIIGDSITFGAGIFNNDLLFSEILEKKFENVNILNAGVPGYNIIDYQSYYKNKLRNLSASLIILQISPNDFEETFIPEAALNNANLYHKIFEDVSLIRCINLYSINKQIIESKEKSDLIQIKSKNKNSFVQLIKNIQADNKTVLVLKTPMIIGTSSEDDIEIQQFIYKKSQEIGFNYINSETYLKNITDMEELLILNSQSSIHFNEKGHELIGKLLHTYITENTLLIGDLHNQ